MENEKVIITKREYNELIRMSKFLSCLYACGIDNWEGYGIALEMSEEK